MNGGGEVSPNGCLCWLLKAKARPCISCRGRTEQKDKGYQCKYCEIGTHEDERNVCANCYYEDNKPRP